MISDSRKKAIVALVSLAGMAGAKTVVGGADNEIVLTAPKIEPNLDYYVEESDGGKKHEMSSRKGRNRNRYWEGS